MCKSGSLPDPAANLWNFQRWPDSCPDIAVLWVFLKGRGPGVTAVGNPQLHPLRVAQNGVPALMASLSPSVGGSCFSCHPSIQLSALSV